MTTINLDPSTLTKNQQTFIAEYNALQQLRVKSKGSGSN